ncbi:hypothetical protein ACFE04_001633 [Oxalis oulophora]
MDSFIVSSTPPSLNDKTKKRKRNRKNHEADDNHNHKPPTETKTPLVKDVVVVNSNIVKSALVEKQPKLSSGRRKRLKKRLQRMNEIARLDLASPTLTLEASLPVSTDHPHVEPSVSTNVVDSALKQPVLLLSRSQRKRLAKKRRKQQFMQQNSEAPADVSQPKDVAGVSLDKDLSTLAEEDGKEKKTKKKRKLESDNTPLPLEAPTDVNKDSSTSAEDGKKKKLDRAGSNYLSSEVCADVSIANDLAGVSVDKDLPTSAEDGKEKKTKKKTKKKRKLEADDTPLPLEAPTDVNKDSSTSAEDVKQKKLDRADKYLSSEVLADVSIANDLAGVSVDKDLFTSAEDRKEMKTKRKRKLDSDSTSVPLEAHADVILADNKKQKKSKIKRKLDPDNSSLTMETPADVRVAMDVATVSLEKDLCMSAKKEKRKKTEKDKRKFDYDDSSLTTEACADVSISTDVAGASLNKEIVPSHSPSQLGVIRGDLDEEDHDFSHERVLMNPPKKKLLILDINGILVDIVDGSTNSLTPDFRVSGKAAFRRPHCDDFLRFCFERFNVGVWSSRTKWNLQKAVDELMGDFKHRLLFEWDRSHCTITKLGTIEKKDKPIVLKELKKLWDKCYPDLPWNEGDFNETNTLLVDDSPYKALRNPAHTAIFPHAFEHGNKEDAFLGPDSEFRVYLEKIAQAENVQKFLEQNPFGQPAITKAHPSWDFYLQVIESAEQSAIMDNASQKHLSPYTREYSKQHQNNPPLYKNKPDHPLTPGYSGQNQNISVSTS